MANEAGTFLLEEAIDDCMLNESADQRLVYTAGTGQFGKRDFPIIRNVHGELVVVDETKTEGIRELSPVYSINFNGTFQQNRYARKRRLRSSLHWVGFGSAYIVENLEELSHWSVSKLLQALTRVYKLPPAFFQVFRQIGQRVAVEGGRRETFARGEGVQAFRLGKNALSKFSQRCHDCYK